MSFLSRFAFASSLVAAVLPALAGAHHHRVRVRRHAHATQSVVRVVSVVESAKVEVAVDPAIQPVVGTWFVTKDAGVDRSMRFALRPNGTFAFVGTTYKSEGTYTVRDGALALEWTKVDGAVVKPGTMHRTLPLNADMNSFVIDQYTYSREQTN